MAFKLNRHRTTGGSIKGRRLHIGGREEAAPGIPLYRKDDLAEGVMAEANSDGTIFISSQVEPGSALEREVLAHEVKHLTDMETGKLSYGDDFVKWNGVVYPRKDGYITYQGKDYVEGDYSLPWEKH
tara:strand:+ start:233 stop:613 length:381 start_codon:yes stop_codon:yes gene_type:complete